MDQGFESTAEAQQKTRKLSLAYLAAAILSMVFAVARPASLDQDSGQAAVDLFWSIKIPLRDGVKLNATGYRPHDQHEASPCVFTLTPYVSQTYHARGMYFAAHGLPFLIVDVRGRGNSEGSFSPNIQEADDGYDIVEWLAQQPYCNGRVSMWGGSYAGFDQWATAKARPPHLASIVPAASPYVGADFPYRNNIASPYLLQWLMYTAGHTSQDTLFNDDAYWSNLWLSRFEHGVSFRSLTHAMEGFDPPALSDWMAHPEIDAYWDRYNPTPEQYHALTIPILTITGSYDGDQPGALTHYRNYMSAASLAGRDRHYLIIGPWDHAATRTPRPDIGGIKFGPASLVDLPALHVQWYNWTMGEGPKPAFLHKHVAFYVMGAEQWRYADTLEQVTSEQKPFFLDSSEDATTMRTSGSIAPNAPGKGKPDTYVYDPRDTSLGRLEFASQTMVQGDPAAFTDQRMVLAQDGKHLVYHSRPFSEDTEISGFFKLSAWIAIDQPDTDFQATVYEIDHDGGSIMLSQDLLRARYRQTLRQAVLISTKSPLRYDFDHFTFVSRRISAGSRLRLVIGPINSIFMQKNFNSGRPVSDETLADARTVKVTLVHDKAHPSALWVPLGNTN